MELNPHLKKKLGLDEEKKERDRRQEINFLSSRFSEHVVFNIHLKYIFP